MSKQLVVDDYESHCQLSYSTRVAHTRGGLMITQHEVRTRSYTYLRLFNNVISKSGKCRTHKQYFLVFNIKEDLCR